MQRRKKKKKPTPREPVQIPRRNWPSGLAAFGQATAFSTPLPPLGYQAFAKLRKKKKCKGLVLLSYSVLGLSAGLEKIGLGGGEGTLLMLRVLSVIFCMCVCAQSLK